MRKLLLLGFLCFCLCVQAQVQNRQLIRGKVLVTGDASPANISVQNTNTQKGTFTNEDGEFIIAVAPEDRLLFSGVQYQDFTVIVDENVVKNKKLNITLNEGVNELKEVIVKPYDLTGDVEIDVKRLKTNDLNLPEQTSKNMTETFGYEFTPDKNSKVENDAMQPYEIKNGLNLVNIFKAVMKSNKGKKRQGKISDEQLRAMYNNHFFKDNLNIDRQNINDFIYYAQDHGMNSKLLREGNELDFIQFLIDQSKAYKKQQE